MQYDPNVLPKRTALYYALCGALWILLSDKLVTALASNPATIEKVSILKGCAFVLTTALLLYWFLWRQVRRMQQETVERRRAEDELARKEALYRTLFELCPDGIVLEDSRGQILDANRAMCAQSGYSREELRKMTVRQLVFPDRIETVETSLAAMRAGQVLAHRLTNRKKDGTAYTVELHEREIQLPDGGKGILVVVKDITERNRDEERLRFHEALLRETGQIAKVGGWSFNPATGEGYWTEQVSEIHGVEYAPTFTRDFGLQFYHGESRRRIEAAIKAATEQGTAYDLELELVTLTGQHKWVRTIGHTVTENGKVVRVRGAFQDITERKQWEAHLRQSQKMDSIGRLAGGVAHDFNNILTVIQANASMLLLPGSQPEAAREHAQEIVHASERAAGLTRQLLLFSRKQVMQPVNLDLNALVAHTIKMLQRILGEDITLETAFAPNPGLIHADPGMMDQVLVNLAVNARDAMPGGGRLTISIRPETVDEKMALLNPEAKPGRYICLTVSDTGCGIAPENLPRVFDPFFTTKDVGKGTGLGLATVYGIVQQHRGWISVESQVDKGTTFQIHLPVTAGEGRTTQPGKSRREIPRGTETILVVEDAALLRHLICDILANCGYTILEAASGREALSVWQEHQAAIQLLLTDIVMPDGIIGIELVAQLREQKPALKVICTSGYSDEIAGGDAILREGFHFLPKPFDALKLGEFVRAALDED